MAFWIFLVNRLFSQKNGNKAGISNQTGVNVSGGVKYKHSNLYYDENGVPWHSKEEADRCIKGTNGSWKKIVSVSDEVKAELAEVVKQDFITTNGWGKLVRENNPGWKPGDAFDTGILDQLDGTIGGVDFRA